jgi:hypothetical protein
MASKQIQLKSAKISFSPFLSFWLIMLYCGFSYGQRIQIRLGNSKIAQNEFYTITLNIQDGALDDFSNFPNIPGFSKAGTSSSSSTSIINGSVKREQNLIQNYMPEKQGVFILPTFSMKVNGQQLRSPGARIEVVAPVERQNQNPFAVDPFKDIFGNGGQNLPEAKADAFFSILADKTEIWAGEGVNLSMSFLVSDQNEAELGFYDIGNQLSKLVRYLKPSNCWEENFGIEEIEQRKVRIGDKNFSEYRIYQASIFPMSPGKIEIPALKLDMHQQSGNPFSQGGGVVKSFYSKPISITVKELPNHPLKGQVSVGNFILEEKLSSPKSYIQQGNGYEFTIKGEGNISYIQPPIQVKTSMLDIYPPNTQQLIQRAGGKITGSKTFSFLLIPKELGPVAVEKSLSWCFFNVRTGKYDTLRPKTVLQVTKGNKSGSSSNARSEDSFFSLLERIDESPIDLSERKSGSLLWYNLAMASMALISLFFMFRRRG